MQQGDCIYGKFPKSPTPIPHYWFVLTNPDANGFVVLVNVTTPTGPGLAPSKAQLLKQSDYPTLEYDSVVYWKGAGPRLEQQVQAAVTGGLFELCPSLSVAKIKEMVAEGEVKCLIPIEVLKLLKAAGL